MQNENGKYMEEAASKSCWSVTFKALAGFAVIMALAYLLGIV